MSGQNYYICIINQIFTLFIMQIKFPDNERAIRILKTKGPSTLISLAAAMNVTTEGARFQLLKLAGEGLVVATTVSKGRGRPQQVWALTPLGNSRFPDTHADLTVKLIEKTRELLGEDALNAVIEANGIDAKNKYLAAVAGITNIEEKIKILVAIRDSEGYMADYAIEEEGFMLVENHCPICAAAAACVGFCKAELNTFQAVLGEDTTIERIDHILAGARRCAYKITPKIR